MEDTRWLLAEDTGGGFTRVPLLHVDGVFRSDEGIYAIDVGFHYITDVIAFSIHDAPGMITVKKNADA